MKLVLSMVVGLSPVDFVLDGDQAALPQTYPIFGPFLLWPNGWMDQDATWHEGTPQPWRLCVRWGPSPLLTKGVEPPTQFVAHFYCGQTAGCIKMPLGMEVARPQSRGLWVRWGPSPLPKGRRRPGAEPPSPNFRPMAIVAEGLDGSRWHLAWS